MLGVARLRCRNWKSAARHSRGWREEFAERFGGTPWRRHLLTGLRAALEALQAARCQRVYVNGSFVTAKAEPADFDACWEADGVDPASLDPVLLDFSDHRRAQKDKFGGELFLAHGPADSSGHRFLDFFQRDRDGRPKGIVAINLGELT